MIIDCYIYTRKNAEIKVPHSIYELFTYEDDETWEVTDVHYGMYNLTRLKNDIEDLGYDLTNEEKEFIEENYIYCKNLFENENVDEIKFLDEQYNYCLT